MGCWSCSTATTTLSVSPQSPTTASVATVSCSASGGSVTGLTVAVSGGSLPGGVQSQYVAGSSASLAWSTPAVAGSYTVSCLVTTGSCTYDPSPNPAVATATVSDASTSPVIDSLQGPASPALAGQTYAFSVAAHDPQGRPLGYQWSASAGAVAASGAAASWTAPAVPGDQVVTVTVTNDLGGTASQAYPVTLLTAIYQGQGPGGVPKPRRLAVTPSGKVFAVDGFGAVWMLTPAGDALGTVALPERALSVAASGNEVFVGTEGSRVVVLDPSRGTVKRSVSLGFSSGPAGMAFEPSRKLLWLAMQSAGQLMAIRPGGSVAIAVPLPGVADVVVDSAHGLVWGMQETNPAGGVASAYTADGAYVRSIVPVGGGAGQVYRANGIAADPAGRIYLSDPMAGQVVVVSATGTAIETLGFGGAGQLTRPAGMVFLANGDLFVADTDRSRLQRYGAGAKPGTCLVGGLPDANCDGIPDGWPMPRAIAVATGSATSRASMSSPSAATRARPAPAPTGTPATGASRTAATPPAPSVPRPVLVASSPAPGGPGLQRFGATVVSQAECSLSWKQKAGPGVVLRGATTLSPSFVARAATTYAFQGVAVCGGAASDPVTVRVEVQDVAPRPDAGRVAVVPAGGGLILDGGFSSDADGDAFSLVWDQTIGSPVAGTTPAVHLPLSLGAAGLYAFQLTAADGAGLSGSAEVPVLAVADGSIAPTAVASTPLAGAAGTFSLDASASVSGGWPAFAWRQVAGPAVTVNGADRAVASFDAPGAGRYGFEVDVTAGGVRSPPARVDVFVAPAGGALPQARVAQPGRATVGEPLSLDGSGSTAGAGGALAYAWRQVEGPAAGLTDGSSAVATVVPFGPGSFVFELAVTEGEAPAIPARARFEATSPRHVNPVAVALAPARGVVQQVVRLDGRPSSGARRFRWTQVAGPWVALDDPSSATPAFRPVLPAAYAFELEVDDGAVRSAPARVSVDVLAR